MDRPSMSMTGAGFAAGACELGDVRIEVRTVNGRSLTTKTRLCQGGSGYEVAIEELVRERVRRGTVTVVVERDKSAAFAPDRALLQSVAATLRSIAGELSLPPPSLADVMQFAAPSRNDAITSRPLP